MKSATVGIVVIGRNEGKRLQRCLRSIVGGDTPIVYVDSGSTDGSVAFAKSLGVDVIDLDMSIPFTMARGRNAGFDHLMSKYPDLDLVQFIDGDCEVVPGYLPAAVQAIHEIPGAVVVSGRRIERYPEASPYNRLCNIEWGKSLGEIPYCGGDMMVRTKAFLEAGKFSEGMIAGEEPELCVRLRLRGGTIHRIDHDMTLHDAAMTQFGQWWKRAKRAGHAYAEGAYLQGNTRFRHKVREVYSGLFWGGLFPVFVMVSALIGIFWPWAWLGVLVACLSWIVHAWRIYVISIRRGLPPSDARLYTLSCMVGKFPHCLGILTFWRNRFFKRKSTLIEYKTDNSQSV